MNSLTKGYLAGWLVTLTITIGLDVVWINPAIKDTAREQGYRAGQIDAAQGKMAYKLTTQPSGETTWEKKP